MASTKLNGVHTRLLKLILADLEAAHGTLEAVKEAPDGRS